MPTGHLSKCLSSAALSIVMISVPASTMAQSASQTTPPSPSNPANAQPLHELMAAAQRLRDATHALVRERASGERNQAIQNIDRTLTEVQNAMISLPPNLLLADANETPSQKATDDLARAADRLRDAVTSLNKTANLAHDQDAISEIKKALASVQQERMNLQGKEASAKSAGSQAQADTSHPTQSLPDELKRQMESAGYTQIQIAPGSYLVSAKDKGGKDVLMRIGPNSMTILTEADSTGVNGATTGQNSSQMK